MNTLQIKIAVDARLPEQSGTISLKTWLKVKEKKAGTGFFPDGAQVMVGDPFGDKYTLLIDNAIADNLLNVSCDVKAKFYSSRTTIEL